MAHSEGFEPSTARFVAEYSIQLSYECAKTSILCLPFLAASIEVARIIGTVRVRVNPNVMIPYSLDAKI